MGASQPLTRVLQASCLSNPAGPLRLVVFSTSHRPRPQRASSCRTPLSWHTCQLPLRANLRVVFRPCRCAVCVRWASFSTVPHDFRVVFGCVATRTFCALLVAFEHAAWN